MQQYLREIVAVFDDVPSLDKAVFTLETCGFDRAAFSLLGREDVIVGKLGHHYRRVTELEDNPKVPRATFFSRVSRLEAEYLPAPALAAVGALMLAGSGAILPAVVAAGGGALIGAALGHLMHERHATRVQEQLERGGLLLWVTVRDANEEDMALKFLTAHSAHDVHTHEFKV